MNVYPPAHHIDGAVVVHPLVDVGVAKNSFPGVADADFGDLRDETVHSFVSATIGRDDFEGNFPHGVINTGDGVPEVVLLARK